MMFLAVAIMLGHNLIGHHHHENDKSAFIHSHGDDHHHHTKGDGEQKDFDLSHILSYLPHDGCDVSFLIGHDIEKPQFQQLHHFVGILPSSISYYSNLVNKRQKAPPYSDVHFDPQQYLPCGLRAPPHFII